MPCTRSGQMRQLSRNRQKIGGRLPEAIGKEVKSRCCGRGGGGGGGVMHEENHRPIIMNPKNPERYPPAPTSIYLSPATVRYSPIPQDLSGTIQLLSFTSEHRVRARDTVVMPLI